MPQFQEIVLFLKESYPFNANQGNLVLKSQLSETSASEGFPGGSDGKESACNAGDAGLIVGSGRFPGEGKGDPLQCSCLEKSMDRGAWRATVHGVSKSWT